MQEIRDIVILMPTYNPDEKFVKFVGDLYSYGYREIVAVNDGSKEETLSLFKEVEDKYGVQVLTHSINLGQGRGQKTMLNYFYGKYGKDESGVGIIQCDCDGQHILEDVNTCAEALRNNQDKFILGTRDFDSKDVPFRSKYGNKITSFVFKFFCALNLKDTQSGLRGIPRKYTKDFIETTGERYEYMSSALLDTKKINLPKEQFQYFFDFWNVVVNLQFIFPFLN